MMVQALVSALGKMREDHKFEVILGDKGRPYLKKKEEKKALWLWLSSASLQRPEDLVTVEYC